MGHCYFLKYALYYVKNESMNKTHFRTLKDLKQFILNENINLRAIIKTEKGRRFNIFDNGFKKWVNERENLRLEKLKGGII